MLSGSRVNWNTLSSLKEGEICSHFAFVTSAEAISVSLLVQTCNKTQNAGKTRKFTAQFVTADRIVFLIDVYMPHIRLYYKFRSSYTFI